MSDVHGLGMAVWSAVAVVWLVLTVAAARRERALRRRAEEALGAAMRSPARRRRQGWERWLRRRGEARGWLAVAGAVSAGYVLVGGVPGVLVGVAVGYGVWRWRRGRAAGADADGRSDGAEAARQLPLAADLLAACVAAGASPVVAAQAVGESLGGPVGVCLARGAAEVRFGAEPADAWRKLGAIPGAGALARLLERMGESGAPAAEPVARVAADARAERGRTATAEARRAAVLMTAPVGLCFLPAFVTVGVLPVVIGLADGLLSVD
ncbi:type II secretion system F family protein [Streptomyces sp. NPDC087300]|uniref:type II secretion system F family protein n=1 Tax=Streptomyces sp. NPDC087300 TaxID=3365780 RepID=UPI0038288661